jgi:hypothetical protein
MFDYIQKSKRFASGAFGAILLPRRMTLAKARRPKAPKASIGRGSHPLTFRISDALHNDLVQASRESSLALAEEARSRMALTFEFDRAVGSRLAYEDGMYLAEWAAVIQRATRAAYDTPKRWLEYADGLPFSTNPDLPQERDRIESLVREKVEAFVKRTKDALTGLTPRDLVGPLRSPAGTPLEVRRAKLNQVILLRHQAIAAYNIERSRAQAEKQALLSDPQVAAARRNKNDPGHQQAIDAVRALDRIIDDATVQLAELEGAGLE